VGRKKAEKGMGAEEVKQEKKQRKKSEVRGVKRKSLPHENEGKERSGRCSDKRGEGKTHGQKNMSPHKNKKKSP